MTRSGESSNALCTKDIGECSAKSDLASPQKVHTVFSINAECTIPAANQWISPPFNLWRSLLNGITNTSTIDWNRQKRNQKFNDQEIDKCVDKVSSNTEISQGPNSTPTQNNIKPIWVAITNRINNVAPTQWEVDEVNQRWQDIKSQTKDKGCF